jgi:AcrR family transcriptional regulator
MNKEPVSEPGGRTQRRDAAANRARILATARQLFATQGVEETSMNQIAQAAGVGAGTLYRNYAHKAELCLALLHDDIEQFQTQTRVLIEEGGGFTALERLYRFIYALIAMTEAHIPLFMGMQEAWLGEKRFGELPFYNWLHAQISQLLQQAVTNGEIAPLDVAFTADALGAVIAPPLIMFQQQNRGFSCERIAAGVYHLFIEGLKPAPQYRPAQTGP